MSLSAATIVFIALHGGPADHFATFAQELSKEGKIVQIYASGPASKKFEERGVVAHPIFTVEEIAEKCSGASVVITDVGHPLAIEIQEALGKRNIRRLAYYDNPEAYVPGGYSDVAAKVMAAAEGVLFANANLADVFPKGRGIGYYTVTQADAIRKQREEKKESLRKELLRANGLVDKGQKVAVYFGGNNPDYFRALEQFLNIIEQADKDDLVFVFQQHPGAKKENIDGKMIQDRAPNIIFSTLSSDDAQTVADLALYYQTSMAPQFLLAGIPALQVGMLYEDGLVKAGLVPSVTTVEGWNKATRTEQKEPPREKVLEMVGTRSNWRELLSSSLR